MHIDEARCDDEAAGIELPRRSLRQVLCNLDDASIINADVSDTVQVTGGVYESSLSKNEMHGLNWTHSFCEAAASIGAL